MKRSPLKPGKPLVRRTPLKAVAFKRLERKEGAALKRVRIKASRKPTTSPERQYLARVAALPCCLCMHLGLGATPAEVHHVRVKHGWGRSGHFATIPLCPLHHRGQPGGIHDMGRDEFTALYGISEFELLAITSRQLGLVGPPAAATAESPDHVNA